VGNVKPNSMKRLWQNFYHAKNGNENLVMASSIWPNKN
jgi:hypothetical protein